MNIRFYRSKEDIKEIYVKKNDYITTIGATFVKRDKKDKTYGLSSQKNLDNLMQKHCVELLSKDIYKKDKCCRICNDKNVINIEDYDGICLTCYDKLKPYFESDKDGFVDKDAVLEDSNVLNQRTSQEINLVEIKEFIYDYVSNIDTWSNLQFKSFKIKRTSGKTTIGTFRRRRCGDNNMCNATITYSHIMHPQSSISTLLHEFVHLYLYVNEDNLRYKNELLVQYTELLLNALLMNDSYKHSYYYLSSCGNQEYKKYSKEAEILALTIFDLICDYLKKAK